MEEKESESVRKHSIECVVVVMENIPEVIGKHHLTNPRSSINPKQNE